MIYSLSPGTGIGRRSKGRCVRHCLRGGSSRAGPDTAGVSLRQLRQTRFQFHASFPWEHVRSLVRPTKPPGTNAPFDWGTLCACVNTTVAQMRKTEPSSSGTQATQSDARVHGHKMMWPEEETGKKGTQGQRTVSRHIAHDVGPRTCRQHVKPKRAEPRDTVLQTEK